MALRPFRKEGLHFISDALDIAEDKTGDYYKFSFDQWKRHRYDVKTHSSLKRGEVSGRAFALLNKCSRAMSGFDPKTKSRDFYFICLQDHQILKALERDKNLTLGPLLVYILTHELVHIVRFSNFYERFETEGKARENEERIVHHTTFDILKDLSLPNMAYVLEAYRNHRICDLMIS
ncbi:MAG: hypothetical protein ABII06_17880 [Pseudomonadota bacterium]